MFQFQDSIFTLHSPVPPGPPLTGVWEISFAEDGVVWLAGYGGFMSYDGSAWTFHELSNMPPIGGVRDLAIAQSGAAWVVGETSASAASFNDGTWEVFNSSNSPISSLPLSIAIDQNDGKWIGTFGGLVHNDGSGWNVFNSSNTCLSSNIIRNIVIDQTGKKWLGHGSSTGLTAFDGTSCVNYNSTNSPVGSVRAITIDKNNSVWVGIGSNGGVAKFDGTWTQYNLPSSFSIRSMAIDSANVLWVGTEGDGIFSFNGNDWHHFNSSNTEIPDDFVNDITVDATGAKWLATDSGLAHFDGTEWTIYDVSNSPLPNNKISAITADKDGNLWLACAGLVLIKGAFEPVANKEAKPALKSSPLKISPNPTCGIFKVEFQEPLPGDFLLLVNDSQGRLFRREMLENTPGFQWHVDLSGLAAGVYLVTACSSEVSFSQKIVKQ
jgi:ligand-binding sensor domain-containing protein